MPDIETPVRLHRLDDDNAIFVGSAEETTTHTHFLVGEVEMTANYPALWLQRDVWEAIGCPTQLMLTLDGIAAPR